MASPTLSLPGDNLKSNPESLPGPGTHKYHSQLFASIRGPIGSTDSSTKKKTSKAQALTTISISRPQNFAILPEVNNVVLARITRLTPRSATCTIAAIYSSSNTSLASSNAATLPPPPPNVEPTAIPQQSQFSGQIRAQDVRATEKDKVVIGEAFRVGDIIRAVVISLGDQRDYYLSTAGNDYGVILAHSSKTGKLMAPVSWQEMRDPDTGKGEGRKVAKPL